MSEEPEAMIDAARAFRAVGESVPFGVWASDATGRWVYVSQSWLDLVGMSFEDARDHGWARSLAPDARERALADWAKCVETECRWDYEHRVRGADGRWYEVLARGVPVRADDGTLIGWAGVNLDVTERRRLETELDEMVEAVESLLVMSPTFEGEGSSASVGTAVCERARQAFSCARASIWVLEDDGMVGLAAQSPEVEGVVLGVREPLAGLLGEYLTRRDTMFIPDALNAGTRVEREYAAKIGVRSALRVPIVVAGRVDALLTLSWTDVIDALPSRVLALVQRFADQAGLALEQARRREAEDETARLSARLQAGLLPTLGVRDERLSITTRYRAGEHCLLLGGDFFDAVETDDGTVALLIGDVAGHGPVAAAVGATMRAAWRGLALDGRGPAESAATLERVLAAELAGDEMFATVAVGSIAPDRASAVFVLAGHPGPLVMGPGGPIGSRDPSGPPLGTSHGGWPIEHYDLRPGWGLLLYTDGLVDARVAPLAADRFGTDRLLAHVAQRVGEGVLDATALDELIDQVQFASGEAFADDVAVMLIQHRPDQVGRAACAV